MMKQEKILNILKSKVVPLGNTHKKVSGESSFYHTDSINNYSRHIQENNEIDSIVNEMRILKEYIAALLENSAGRENEYHMSIEILSRLEQKVNSMDEKLQKVIIDTAETRTEIRVRFEGVNKSLDSISDALSNLVTKEDFNKKVENSRFNLTTVLAAISSIAAIIAAVVGFIQFS